MKRIVFYIKQKPSLATRLSFAVRMAVRGVKVSLYKESAEIYYNPDNLYVTDSEISYSRICKAGGKALAVIVLDDDSVKNAVIQHDKAITPETLMKVSTHCNLLFAGHRVWRAENDLLNAILKEARKEAKRR